MLYTVFVLGGMGLVAGAALAFASKYFYVEKDEKVEAVKEMLPGANCGACGYAGCGMLAQAICNNEVPVSVCSALKEDEIRNIASLLGQTVTDSIRMKAYIKCTGGTNCQNRYEYFGPADCICMSQYDGGVKSCIYGCVGGGSCQRACLFDAIIMNEYNMAEIVYDKCTGCGVCVEECPKNLIFLSSEHSVYVACNSSEKGGIQKQFCNTGCIGCKKCEKVCNDNAIHVENFLASIDYSKCIKCNNCVDVCPCDVIKF